MCENAEAVEDSEAVKDAEGIGYGKERRKFMHQNMFRLEGRISVPPPPAASVAEEPKFVAAAACGASMRSLDDVVKNISETWSESLLRMITEKGYSDVEVYRRANVDRKLFSKIRSNKDYKPKKSTAVAFALALKLNLDETKDFIGRAGYAFSPSSKFDLIVEYFIENEVYEFMTINMALFEHNEPLLG